MSKKSKLVPSLRAARHAAEEAPDDARIRFAYGSGLLRNGYRAAAWHELNAAESLGLPIPADLKSTFVLEKPGRTSWRFVPFHPQGLAPEVDDARVPGVRVRSGEREVPLVVALGPPCTKCDEKCEIACVGCGGSGWHSSQSGNSEDECPGGGRQICNNCLATKFVVGINRAGKGGCRHPESSVEMRTDQWSLERCTRCGLAAMKCESVPYWSTGYACGKCGLLQCACRRASKAD